MQFFWIRNCMLRARVLLNHLVVGPPLKKKKESRSDAVLFNVNNSSSSLSVPQYFVCCRFLGKFSSSSFSSYLMFSFRKRFSFLNETVISSLKKRKRRGSLGAHWEYKLGFCRTSDIFFSKNYLNFGTLHYVKEDSLLVNLLYW